MFVSFSTGFLFCKQNFSLFPFSCFFSPFFLFPSLPLIICGENGFTATDLEIVLMLWSQSAPTEGHKLCGSDHCRKK